MQKHGNSQASNPCMPFEKDAISEEELENAPQDAVAIAIGRERQHRAGMSHVRDVARHERRLDNLLPVDPIDTRLVALPPHVEQRPCFVLAQYTRLWMCDAVALKCWRACSSPRWPTLRVSST